MRTQKGPLEVANLQRGEHVPHFDVAEIEGSRARYGDLWQRRNLLLLSLPDDDRGEFREYTQGLTRRRTDFEAAETALVMTKEPIAGVPRPGLLIADRWGEIYSVVEAPTASKLPSMDDLFEWVAYIQQVCPECQGESK